MEHDNLFKMRHSAAHLLAMAVLKLRPNAKLGIGPVIENGFYYDFDFDTPLSTDDFTTLEATMQQFITADFAFTVKPVSKSEALSQFKDQAYKIELINELEDGDITVYTSGDFEDLCKGPHVERSGQVSPHFKLTSLAGAYWRGDEKRPMLQRIYGVLFETQQELDDYLLKLEEAKKRDHRKLGQELDLFSFSDLVGGGLPLWSPKGTMLRNLLQNALIKISEKYDTYPVTIPHLAKIDLYKISGHAEKFADELFHVKSHYDVEFVLKPVNCPHHTQIYASRPRSYRDLPLRYMESTMQYRDEKPGEIGGLTRVRAITCDDGHIFCRVDQIEAEAKAVANIIREFYSNLGMYGNHWVSLSVRDSANPQKYIGDESDWQAAEAMLQKVSDDLELGAKRMEGEAAIYGPKLDFMFKDSMGRERQLATVQLDFAMPKRFNLTYADADGSEKHPVMIHRAVLGSYERFLAILIEHFAGDFPAWLAPVQVAVLPISEKFSDYAESVVKDLKQKGVRVWLDTSNESIGKKIRNAEVQKYPIMLIVGGKEAEVGTVSVRSRKDGDLGSMTVAELLDKVQFSLPN